jgi:hypothetical protein
MGTTVRVASIRDEGQVFHEKRTPVSTRERGGGFSAVGGKEKEVMAEGCEGVGIDRSLTDRPSPPARRNPCWASGSGSC